MKAPRKTVKRPIYRHIKQIEDDEKIEIKADEKIVESAKPEEKKDETNILDTLMIEFGNNDNLSPLTNPVNDILNDIDLDNTVSYPDIINIDGEFDLNMQFELDEII